MLIILGLLIVLGSIIAGYILERGQIAVLLQPAELLIIGGATLGILLISNPKRDLRRLLRLLRSAPRDSSFTPAFFLDTLKLMYVLFSFGRRAGLAALEKHVDEPSQSEIFAPYPAFLGNRGAVTYFCDSLRLVISAGVDPSDLEQMMSNDMEVQRHGRAQPLRSLAAIADSLPGLGIVAAVLGVVVTMQALGGPAAQIGQKVAAALVGTFLGILMCYGVVGPLVSHLECLGRVRWEHLQVMKIGLISYLKGASPLVATEFARRSIPVDLRPTFDAMEQELRRNTRMPTLPDSAGGTKSA